MRAEDDGFWGGRVAGMVCAVDGGNDFGEGEGDAVVDSGEGFAVGRRDEDGGVRRLYAGEKGVEDLGGRGGGVGEWGEAEPFTGKIAEYSSWLY